MAFTRYLAANRTMAAAIDHLVSDDEHLHAFGIKDGQLQATTLERRIGRILEVVAGVDVMRRRTAIHEPHRSNRGPVSRGMCLVFRTRAWRASAHPTGPVG